MKHLLIILISILLLSSFLVSCEKKEQVNLTLPNGNKYVGEFKDGKQNGRGTFTWGKGEWEGDMYVGEYKDGKQHGQGTETYPSGSKYVGEWKDGLRNGLGTKTWSNGDKYQGEWKNGERTGQGTYTSQDGTKGKGEFKDNTPWNISLYGKYGNFTGKYVNGVKQ